jgi:glycosyltransferase involved in cell wall biosynthesis
LVLGINQVGDSMKISLVIPVFNEEITIKSTLIELENYMIAYEKSSDWEIITVNDGSTDSTLDILNTLRQSKNWLKVIDLGGNYGRGKALRAGIERASGNVIVSLDADLSYAPYHIQTLVDAMKKHSAEIVVASAYAKGGTVKNVPLKRLYISKIGNKILSYMFGSGISVLTCMVRAYRKDFIDSLDLHSNDKEIHLEILHKAKIVGAKIIEVPADLCWRKEKLLKSNSAQQKRRSTIKIGKTSSSHIFFALLSKPGFIFWIPGYILFALSLTIFFITIATIINDLSSGLSLYQLIRISMLNAAPSWFTMCISLIIAIVFFTLGFLTNQSKQHYEETYKTLSAIYSKINQKGN